ncbi:putative F-box domain, leucine-rich repeat domain superfamily, F-box-like domain superfamily [Helianthus annuus]|nr:putative F-box domain, leucine-rich repeat domain superfamily, F-box-like domain superfamily [Helianthus annuus]KAJ0505569.1 putative F-box domain, leucine-rich repeat domain superfamily, F-box-like domain superfamily [Helianthus annuus]KAJ0675238.1 putative F-box domain, leucine-rich repeat domain superfamily, F-box-like domain superfamily [Helianthus annuus]
MTLNFTQRPIFPAHTSEDNMVSQLRTVNGEKGGQEEVHDRFGYRREIVDKGWFGDLELEYGDHMRNKVVNHKEDYRLFAGFNFFWNSAMKFQSLPTNLMYHDQHNKGFDRVSESVVVTKCGESVNEFAVCPDVIGGDPHDAFVLSLSYLGTKDLLMVERVCRSLCYTIRNDSLLWRNLYIDQPLNERITDDILVRLTNRAEGNLRFLSLIKCPKITDDGLRRVLETNPKLTKLFIPGCTRLSIEGILNNLKAFNSSTETAGIKHIRTGGFYGITLDHYEQLNNLLGVQNNKHIPNYYHLANLHAPCDDDRALDVEICPRCQNLRLVYDCPAGGCRPKDQCRACIICIPRCAECGRCVHNSEYEETFSLEYLCSECLKQLPRCQEPHG